MKKLLSLLALSCAIFADSDNGSTFPHASDTCGTYMEKCLKSVKAGQNLIKFSYFNPWTWFSKDPLSPEQVQAVHDAYIWDKGFSIALLHANSNLYALSASQAYKNADAYAQLLHTSTLPTIPAEAYQILITRNIQDGINLAQKNVPRNFNPSLASCYALRDAFIYQGPRRMMTEGHHSKLSPKQFQKDMASVFALLRMCSNIEK